MTALEDEMQDVTKRANEMHRALVRERRKKKTCCCVATVVKMKNF